jgi:putative ABC transport system substrate-binding protein
MDGSFADARYEEVFDRLVVWGAQAVMVADVAEHFPKESLITGLAARHRLPLISQFRHFTEAGALMSYGVDWVEVERRRAAYVAQILKGAKPGDLPVEQPTEFELVINTRTAKALNLSVSPTILARADAVIE